MKKIAGQVILLTKAIFLTEPKSEPGYLAQFIAGKQGGFFGGGEFVLTWWLTKKSFKAIEAVASMLIELTPEFANCDIESVIQTIYDTLKEVCFDKRIFNPDMVCFSRKQTLFECKQPIDVIDFAQIILDDVIVKLRNSILRYCTIFVAPRLTGSTFFIENLGISIIAKSDESAWQAFLKKGYYTRGWDPLTGDFLMSEKTVFSSYKYDYVFVCEEKGTQKGSQFNSQLKLRRLFSIIFAIIAEQSVFKLTKAIVAPYTFCMQLTEESIVFSEIGSLIPYYINDHVLLDKDIVKIREWFDSAYRLQQDSMGRVEKCAHFINRAMNSDDIESYINYYISLDALFGERGSVEVSILHGIKELNLKKPAEEKASWLFDLRNELVHGGSRYIREWPKYERYYRHFDSRPEEDLEKLAFAALKCAPNVLA